MFDELIRINTRPEPFQYYTAAELWTDEHTSGQMLAFHLNQEVDLSSRRVVFIDRSVKWIASRFNLGAGVKVADFGCGPGLYAVRLAQTGAEITGVDFSERSISYARNEARKLGLSINYLKRNYLEFETDERFDLILMIWCDFCALSPSQRRTVLTKFHAFLNPGGAVLLDVHSLPAFEERKEAAIYEPDLLDGFWSAEPYFGFLNTFKYGPEKVVLDKYTIVQATGSRTVYNWLQYFSPETLEKEMVECGFRVEEVYSDVAGSPFDPKTAEFAVVAVKP